MIRKNISITAIILGFAAVSASGNTVTDSLTVKEPVDLQRLIHVTDSLACNYKFNEAVPLSGSEGFRGFTGRDSH